MISVDEARARILSAFAATPVARVPLLDALGLSLAEDVLSPIDVPPFDTAAMDGFAVRASDVAVSTAATPIEMAVIGQAPAGAVCDVVVAPGTAIRIMTDAPVPRGTT